MEEITVRLCGINYDTGVNYQPGGLSRTVWDSASEKRDMQVRDPDGNLLTLATPPSPPFPPA